MKYAALLFSLLTSLLFSSEKTILFLPDDKQPFFLNSPSGMLTLESGDDTWPSFLRIGTEGEGSAAQATAHSLPPFSLAGRHILLWVKFRNVAHLREFWLYAGDSEDFSDRAVFMPSDDRSQFPEDEWICLRLPPSAAKLWGSPDWENLTAFQFWVSDRGTAPVSVDIGPVFLEEAEQESALVMTFDDGWKSQIETAAPLMKEKGLRGTAYVIPELVGTEGYMTEQDILRLTGEYGWSLGGHYAGRLDTLEAEERKAALDSIAGWFDARHISAPDFSYPNGAFESGVREAVMPYFRSGRTIIEYPETIPPADPYLIKVMNIVPPVNLDTLRTRLDSLAGKGELLVLVFHRIEADPLYETEIGISDFESLCSLIEKSGVPVRTMEEVSSAFPTAEPALPVWPAAGLAYGEGENGGTHLPEDWLHRDSPDDQRILMPTQIDFSLDLKMVWGLGGNPRYYSQLDEVSLYLQNELSDSARLFTSFGIRDSSIEDLSGGGIDGTLFSLNTLYLEQDLPRDLSLSAGYFSPAPHHKWLLITRSAKLEPAFGQDITPDYLWLGLALSGQGPFGIQAAAIPDFSGKPVSDYSLPVLTYEKEDSPGDGYKLGVPNLFSSVWYDSDRLDGELAAALNGDAVKIAAEGALSVELGETSLLACLGAKYTRGGNFTTFPDWDHLDNALRLSTGLALYRGWGSIIFNPGTAYRAFIDESGSIRHQYGIDAGLFYKNMELYTVWNFFDLETLLWGENAGFEAGLSLDYEGVTFITGYTMGGFNAASGLYGNNDDNEGALDGPFLRIKATYW